MNFDDLDSDDQLEIEGMNNEVNDIQNKLTSELEAIGEAVLPKKAQDKLRIYFEMLAEKKANIIAKRQVATILEKTNDYMEYVVKEFVDSKEKEIKEAVELSKKAEIYENFKYLVEKMYGNSTTNIMEAKKTEEFLINLLEGMKSENEKMERKLNEAKETVKEMECKIIFNEMTKDISFNDKDRIAEFVSSFEFKNTKDFESKLKLVKESFDNLKKDDKKKNIVKNVKIDENKIEKAVKNQKLNENISESDYAEIDPASFKSNLW